MPLWRHELHRLLRRKAGLSLKAFAHLADDIREAFDEGVTPDAYFDDVVRHELEDLGFPCEDLESVARAVEFAREGDGESLESLLGTEGDE